MKLPPFLFRPQPQGPYGVVREMGRRMLRLGSLFLLFTAGFAFLHFVLEVPLDTSTDVPERPGAIYAMVVMGGTGLLLALNGWAILSWVGPAPHREAEPAEPVKRGVFYYANVFMAIWRTLIITAVFLVLLVAILLEIF